MPMEPDRRGSQTCQPSPSVGLRTGVGRARIAPTLSSRPHEAAPYASIGGFCENRIMLRTIVAASAILGAGAIPAFAQGARVRGVVTDSTTGAPLAQVRVEWRATASASRSSLTVYTDEAGRFTIVTPVQGPSRMVLTRVGYAPTRLENVQVTGADSTLHVALAAI